MRVLLLNSFCEESGCCDELPCENCLSRCLVVDIEGQYVVKGLGESYEGLRAMVKEDAALDEEGARMKMRDRENFKRCDHNCNVCPDEDLCLGED